MIHKLGEYMDLYDKSSVDSIVSFAGLIHGKSLEEVTTLPAALENPRNRGDLGKMVEDFFFKHSPRNDGNPDFSEAGLELKTTGVLKNSRGEFRAKERLVLTQINYMKLVLESWESSSLLHKCRLMLVLFYQYEKEFPVYSQKFVLSPLLYQFPGEDLAQIRRDWEFIQSKVFAGKAHELSEGDTFYLAACRKGSGGPDERLLPQPFSEELAKSRAFSLKASYLTKILRGHENSEAALGISESMSFEEATKAKFLPYLGKTVDEISRDLDYFKLSKNQKGFNRSLTNRMLAKGGISVAEIVKAGIRIKTIRVSGSGKPFEDMSFKAFDYCEIVNQSWDDSAFAEELEDKFLFVVFQKDSNGLERFVQVSYWNMPYEDREIARGVWELAKANSRTDANIMPKMSENPVAHVRPHGKDSNDKILTPQGDYIQRKGFWLNRGYIQNVLSSLE